VSGFAEFPLARISKLLPKETKNVDAKNQNLENRTKRKEREGL
jgi:hypothetical protein